MEYILGGKDVAPADPEKMLPGSDPECFLCRAAPNGGDRQNRVVARGPATFALLNRYPYNNGHLLVAPQRHVARLDELEDPVQLELFQSIARMVGMLERAMQPQGFNIGVNLGRAAAPACLGTSTGTSSPAGSATRTLCPPLPASTQFPSRSMRCGRC